MIPWNAAYAAWTNERATYAARSIALDAKQACVANATKRIAAHVMVRKQMNRDTTSFMAKTCARIAVTGKSLPYRMFVWY